MLLCSNELLVVMPSRTFVWDPQHWRRPNFRGHPNMQIIASAMGFFGNVAFFGQPPKCDVAHTSPAQLRVTLMGGKWPEQHWERNEIVDGSDCPTLRVKYRPSS